MAKPFVRYGPSSDLLMPVKQRLDISGRFSRPKSHQDIPPHLRRDGAMVEAFRRHWENGQSHIGVFLKH